VANASQPANDASAAAAPDAGQREREEVKIAATNFQASIVSLPAWPESGASSRRIGYLRHGAETIAYAPAIQNNDCKDGWYELLAGGYVCGKAVTTDLTSPRVRLAPKQPDRESGMPYRYGVNLVDGTPLYRRALGAESRKKYEPEKPEKTEKPEKSADTEKDEPVVATSSEGAGNASAEDQESAAGSSKSDKSDDSAVDAGVDAGKPTLKSLRGRGVLVRKLARGFYLALDRDFRSANAHWWRTTFGLAVPFEPIMVQRDVTKYVGSSFDAPPDESDADASVPSDAQRAQQRVGFVLSGYVRKYELASDGKKMSVGGELPRRSAVLLLGQAMTISGMVYERTTAGFWVRMMDLTLATPQIPADVAPDEKWIDIDLTRQALVAFEGTRPVFATLVSAGRRNPADKEHDFRTPTGTFRIREKHVTTTMAGDVASDGPYSIEEVPWVMYFQGSYALHGAFWHDAFGRPRSHGCVNLSPEDARTLFNWANPPLPAAWHGVFARDDKQGSRVVVHEDAPAKRRATPTP